MICKSHQSYISKVMRPARYKATQQDKNNYTELFDLQLFIPDSLTIDNEFTFIF